MHYIDKRTSSLYASKKWKCGKAVCFLCAIRTDSPLLGRLTQRFFSVSADILVHSLKRTLWCHSWTRAFGSWPVSSFQMCLMQLRFFTPNTVHWYVQCNTAPILILDQNFCDKFWKILCCNCTLKNYLIVSFRYETLYFTQHSFFETYFLFLVNSVPECTEWGAAWVLKMNRKNIRETINHLNLSITSIT